MSDFSDRIIRELETASKEVNSTLDANNEIERLETIANNAELELSALVGAAEEAKKDFDRDSKLVLAAARECIKAETYLDYLGKSLRDTYLYLQIKIKEKKQAEDHLESVKSMVEDARGKPLDADITKEFRLRSLAKTEDCARISLEAANVLLSVSSKQHEDKCASLELAKKDVDNYIDRLIGYIKDKEYTKDHMETMNARISDTKKIATKAREDVNNAKEN